MELVTWINWCHHVRSGIDRIWSKPVGLTVLCILVSLSRFYFQGGKKVLVGYVRQCKYLIGINQNQLNGLCISAFQIMLTLEFYNFSTLMDLDEDRQVSWHPYFLLLFPMKASWGPISFNEDEGKEEEVKDLVRWAKDAARLNPSVIQRRRRQ